MMRRLRGWAWNHRFVVRWSRRLGCYSTRRIFVPWLLSELTFIVARCLDRDPKRCWLSLAMWAMGFDGYFLSDKVTSDGCDYCGKCSKR
jgi:hypothetical protein